MSRQQELKLRYKAAGRCVDCGKPAEQKDDGTTATRCAACREKHRMGNGAKKHVEYHGRVSGKARHQVEWTFKYGTHGARRKTPPITCPVCKIKTCAEYWFCPWCGAEFLEVKE